MADMVLSTPLSVLPCLSDAKKVLFEHFLNYFFMQDLEVGVDDVIIFRKKNKVCDVILAIFKSQSSDIQMTIL